MGVTFKFLAPSLELCLADGIQNGVKKGIQENMKIISQVKLKNGIVTEMNMHHLYIIHGEEESYE